MFYFLVKEDAHVLLVTFVSSYLVQVEQTSIGYFLCYYKLESSLGLGRPKWETIISSFPKVLLV